MIEIADKSDDRLEDVLREQGAIVTTATGVSMLPMIRQHVDTVIVAPVRANDLRPMDVVLFRNARTGTYILHRLVALDEGMAVTLGDNCTSVERTPQCQVFGRLEGLYRGERKVSLISSRYRLYVLLWCRPWKLRMRVLGVWRRARAKAGQAARRLGLKRRRKR